MAKRRVRAKDSEVGSSKLTLSEKIAAGIVFFLGLIMSAYFIFVE